ncbi:hypothetical protein GP486_006329 [Trichoglossum hirsutum]|uniref:Translation initiation factor 5A-like N-terminal domain-containing protein n=1 Tax=Trichoglossum hirsutum TaxID=265104 RepID=A0A9P8I8B1_9PEZI|nr:hypothetical protein GP486_006329 [Trichoglossum hirsutum]
MNSHHEIPQRPTLNAAQDGARRLVRAVADGNWDGWESCWASTADVEHEVGRLQQSSEGIGADAAIGRWIQDAHTCQQPITLDFDARVPIPFSVFPSSYRSDAASSSTTQVRVEGEVNLPSQTSRVGREGHESRYYSASAAFPDRRDSSRYEDQEVTTRVYEERDRPRRREEYTAVYEEERERERERPRHREDYTTTVYEEDRYRRRDSDASFPEVQYTRDTYREPERSSERVERTEFDAEFPHRHHRERELTVRRPTAEFGPSEATVVEEASYSRVPTVVDTFERRYSEPREDTREKRVEFTATVDAPTRHTDKMGYYSGDGHHHSFRHGFNKIVDDIFHPDHRSHHRDDYDRRDIRPSTSSSTTVISATSRRGIDTVSIPCHHIRTGDVLYLQGRPCLIIRISTSAQTGQHRYVGVDLFTKQLHEDTSVVSHPSPSVLLQTMPGPIFRQYRLLDVRDDFRVVAITENGDVRQNLRVANHGRLWARLNDAFADGRGSVRVLVIRDGPDELAVDFKLVHGSRL